MSRIAFEPPGSVDALNRLGLESGTFAGQGATGIDFVGTVPWAQASIWPMARQSS